MLPRNPVWNRIDTSPRNGLPSRGEFREFLDRGLVPGNGGVALHALCDCWNRHRRAGVGIGVTLLAFQAESQMRLVAVGNRL